MFGTRYRIRTGVNAVKGHYPRPLDEPSKKGRATVAGPSAPKRRRYPGDVALKIWIGYLCVDKPLIGRLIL